MEYEELTNTIIGCAFRIYNILGCGFLEAVYQEALEQEFIIQGIPYVREKELLLHYKGKRLNTSYRVDFFCYDEIPVELKALSALSGTEDSQIINYLKASETSVGLLINFGGDSLEYKRFVN